MKLSRSLGALAAYVSAVALTVAQPWIGAPSAEASPEVARAMPTCRPSAVSEIDGTRGEVIAYPRAYCTAAPRNYVHISIHARLLMNGRVVDTSEWVRSNQPGGRLLLGRPTSVKNRLGSQEYCLVVVVDWTDWLFNDDMQTGKNCWRY